MSVLVSKIFEQNFWKNLWKNLHIDIYIVWVYIVFPLFQIKRNKIFILENYIWFDSNNIMRFNSTIDHLSIQVKSIGPLPSRNIISAFRQRWKTKMQSRACAFRLDIEKKIGKGLENQGTRGEEE